MPRDLEALLERVDKLEEAHHRTDSVMKVVKWLVGICLSAALAAVISLCYKIYSEGYSKGVLVDRVDHLEKSLEHLRKETKEKNP